MKPSSTCISWRISIHYLLQTVWTALIVHVCILESYEINNSFLLKMFWVYTTRDIVPLKISRNTNVVTCVHLVTCDQYHLCPTPNLRHWKLIMWSTIFIIQLIEKSTLVAWLSSSTLDDSVIAHPHLLVRATNEQFLPPRATFKVDLANESHWL